MRIAIGNGTAIGRHSIGLGDETDARTFDVEESRDSDLDNLTYDMMTDTFIPSDTQETSLQSPSSGDFTSSLPFQHMSSEIPPTTRKRNRMEFDGKSTSFETNKAQTEVLERMNQSINKLNQSIDSIDTRDYSCWDLIKEIPNLDKQAQYKALKLLNTRAKKIEFYKMTPQERSDWINFELQN